jgi:hypothetical protein
MNAPTTSSSIAKLSAAMKADPKKTIVLGSLSVVLLVMVGRLVLSGSQAPAPAAASLPDPPSPTVKSEPTARSGRQTLAPGVAMAKWLRTPSAPLSRNLFTVKFDHFPTDGRSAPPHFPGSDTNSDSGPKSPLQQADMQKERQVYMENLRHEAGQLHLQSIMMGPEPKAIIEGRLVAVGDVIASFRVLRIEARSVIVEREGVKLEIQMK